MGSEDEDHYEHNNYHGTVLTIILASTLFLVGITVLITLLYFYAKYLQRRQQRTRLHNLVSRVRPQIAPINVESPNCGLDPLIIASLPRILYKETDHFMQGEVMECSVCLTTIIEDATIRVLPNCKHMFHVDCVDMWFGSNNTCPVCRAVVEPMVHEHLATPTAPLVEDGGVSQDANHELEKVGCSGLRIPSFSRMGISRERSIKNQSSDGCDSVEDVEKQ